MPRQCSTVKLLLLDITDFETTSKVLQTQAARGMGSGHATTVTSFEENGRRPEDSSKKLGVPRQVN